MIDERGLNVNLSTRDDLFIPGRDVSPVLVVEMNLGSVTDRWNSVRKERERVSLTI